MELLLNDLISEVEGSFKTELTTISSKIKVTDEYRSDSEQDLFHAYAKWSDQLFLLNQLSNLLSISLPSDMSATKVARLSTLMTKIKSLVQKQANHLRKYMDENYLAKATECATLDEFMKIREKFRKWPSTVDLFVLITQKTIDYFYTNNKLDMYKIITIIEEDKDKALPEIDDKFTSVIYKNQPSIKRFGLVPVCESGKL